MTDQQIRHMEGAMTLEFCDVSHWNGDYHPVGPTLAKATEGDWFTDGQYTTNRQRTLAGGWPFGGYHFLVPNAAASIVNQVGRALSVIGKSTPTMLDVETGTKGHPSWADTKNFITEYRSQGGIIHLAYIPEWYWANYWGKPDLSWLTDNDVVLISSHYVKTYSDSGVGWDAYGNVKPGIWQFTDGATSNGYSYGIGGVDTNAFKGTVDELRALFETGHIDMALVKADVATLAGTDGVFDNFTWSPDYADTATATGNKFITLDNKLDKVGNEAHAARTEAAALSAKVDALTTAVKALQTAGVDLDVLAAKVADLLATRLQS